jgi:hypothetical protein
MESLFSFPVGLLHPLQHAGLSRRSPTSRLFGQVTTIALSEPDSEIDPSLNAISVTDVALQSTAANS